MKRIFLLSIAMLLLFSGCGVSTQLTSSWKAEETISPKLKRIVVLGLIRDNEGSLRETMEQHLVDDLKALGYDAVCSCNEYNPKLFENMSEQQAIDKLRNAGVDAVLTIVLLNKTRERYYIPQRVQYSAFEYSQNRFWNYSRFMFDRIYSDEYYVTDTKYYWESNLYDLAGNKLLYSAQSQSFDPNSTNKLGHEYGQVIIKDLVKKNVLTMQIPAPVKKAM
ncbi:MAG: hypothetical protein IPI78_04775 [Chitinophagaceae bacterium]|nr:hypothetical protein [Chitinophagaceae bacterium]